jgi:3',5'-cyclic-AMP phosphodiesterase
LKLSEGSCIEKIRMVQITDPHLFANPDTKIVGLNSEQSCKDVIALVKQQQHDIACLLCTGDISQDASESSYQKFYDHISSFGTESRWIPGNHDVLTTIESVLGINNSYLNKTFSIGNWQVIMLNTCVEGMVHGQLTETELSFLDQALVEHVKEVDQHNVLICLHHNPMPVKAAWLNQHSLQNSDDFFSVLDKYSSVRGVLCGHIHQEIDILRKGVRLMASPSTCVQFHPGNDEFTLDHLNPGYRWLDLLPDGGIETGVERVLDKTYETDFSSGGY